MPRILLILVGAACVQASSIGAASRRRFLLIHGAGTSAGAFMNSPTASGAKKFLSGVPCRTDAGGGGIPANWQYTALDAASDDGGWWKGGDELVGLEASISRIENAIEMQQAVGVIGHEQGALVAALVAARASLGEGPPLQFAVICGAPALPTGVYLDLLQRLRDSTAVVPVATLHCLSKADPASAAGEELAACFAPAAEILWHEGGNSMPGRSWYEETRGFPDRAIGENRYVTQLGPPRYYKYQENQ